MCHVLVRCSGTLRSGRQRSHDGRALLLAGKNRFDIALIRASVSSLACQQGVRSNRMCIGNEKSKGER
eukprot:2610852-Rhodomonas_salina.3